MKRPITSQLSRLATALSAALIVVAPFYALLSVWPASDFGHYTVFRLWDEVLLAIILLLVAGLLLADRELRQRCITNKLLWLLGAYLLVQIVTGVVAHQNHTVTAKALGFAWIVDLRFLVFFAAVWLIAQRHEWLARHWPGLLLVPAALVTIFGLLQALVLPLDFLRHFGYSPGTILPFETINHNHHYIRILSTLRGANPLGAYLVVVISALGVLLLRTQQNKRRLGYGLFSAGALGVLYFSGSRSAWIGAVLAVLVVLLVRLQGKRRYIFVGGLTVVIVFAGLLGFGLRHNTRFENEILHTQAHSAVKTTSDAGHVSALKSGLSDVVHEPLGRGPGSAGPASVYNKPHGARIAENYFIQIGQEVGWLGLLLFLAINVVVGRELWLRRQNSLALALFAGLIGVTLVNLLSHAWTDDTLAYVFWGLAAVSLAPPRTTPIKS